MRTQSWIDLELSAVFGNIQLPKDEAAIVAELQRIDRIVAERRAALTVQSADKARAFKSMRRSRFVSASA